MTAIDNDELVPKLSFRDAYKVGKTYLKQGYNIMFTGKPGIGKTDLTKLLSRKLGYELIIFHPAISEPTDFKGFPFIAEDGNARFVPFDELKELIQADKPTICLFDDFGQAAPATQAAMMQLLYARELGGKKVSKHIRYIACTNRKEDNAAVSGILEPIRSRFHGIFELQPDVATWCTWAAHNNLAPEVIAFVKMRPSWLDGLAPESSSDGAKGTTATDNFDFDGDVICNSPNPRSIKHLSDIYKLDLPDEVHLSAFAGAVGIPMALEFKAFDELAGKMPYVGMILSTPESAPAPQDTNIMFALLGVFYRKATEDNLDNIMTYVKNHFPVDMQYSFVFDLPHYSPNLKNHAALTTWKIDNGNFLANNN